MIRNQVNVTLSSNLVGMKFKEFYATFLRCGSACLREEISKLSQSEPYTFEEMNYLEDNTNEVRKVTCIKFGLPVQASVNFYR